MKFQIIKCHGSENDFVMIDEISQDYGFTEAQRAIIAQTLCDRNGEIGADGILYFVPSEQGDGMMRMFNPDGSEAEMCGNGIRCIGRLAHEVLGKPKFMIETLKGLYPMQVEAPIYGDIPTYSVAINTISFKPNDLPSATAQRIINKPIPRLSNTREFTGMSLTNPHLIALVEKVTKDELKSIGEKANKDKVLFSKGINVSLCAPVNDHAIFTGTYERGAGITFSCGTGMSASTIAACMNGQVPFNTWIDVYNQGGMVRCKVDADYPNKPQIVHLLGNATYVFTANVELNEEVKTFQVSDKVDFKEEEAAYRSLKNHVEELLGSVTI